MLVLGLASQDGTLPVREPALVPAGDSGRQADGSEEPTDPRRAADQGRSFGAVTVVWQGSRGGLEVVLGRVVGRVAG